jgi:hypothetical protein
MQNKKPNLEAPFSFFTPPISNVIPLKAMTLKDVYEYVRGKCVKLAYCHPLPSTTDMVGVIDAYKSLPKRSRIFRRYLQTDHRQRGQETHTLLFSCLGQECGFHHKAPPLPTTVSETAHHRRHNTCACHKAPATSHSQQTEKHHYPLIGRSRPKTVLLGIGEVQPGLPQLSNLRSYSSDKLDGLHIEHI